MQFFRLIPNKAEFTGAINCSILNASYAAINIPYAAGLLILKGLLREIFTTGKVVARHLSA